MRYLTFALTKGRHAEKTLAMLEKLGVTHVFTHAPGAHTWEFWDDSVRAAFDYFFGK